MEMSPLVLLFDQRRGAACDIARGPEIRLAVGIPSQPTCVPQAWRVDSPVALALWCHFAACDETSSQTHQAEEANWVFEVGWGQKSSCWPLHFLQVLGRL